MYYTERGEFMKYALIGCGRIAVNHMKAVFHHHLELIAVCDLESEKMENILEPYGGKQDSAMACYINYKQMIEEHPELELVAIATSSGSHAEIALYCIRHGIHVMIEKPIAMSIEDADHIIEAGRKYNVLVCACHQNRFNVAVQKTRKALEEGRFGNLSHGSIHVRWNRRKKYYDQASWRGTWAEDGGCLMNQCIHGIDLLRWMMGEEVDTVYGVIRRQQHSYLETEDIGMAVLTFKNGAIATIEGTTNVYPKNLEETLYLFGEKGTVKIGGTSTNNLEVWDFLDETQEDQKNKELKEPTSNVYGNGHIRLYADMIDAIEHHRQPYVDALAGRNALELVLAVYQSAKTGQVVSLPLTKFASIDMRGVWEHE